MLNTYLITKLHLSDKTCSHKTHLRPDSSFTLETKDNTVHRLGYYLHMSKIQIHLVTQADLYKLIPTFPTHVRYLLFLINLDRKQEAQE